jgi:hypothetical protein
MLELSLLCSGPQLCASVPLFVATLCMGFAAGGCLLEKERGSRMNRRVYSNVRHGKEVWEQESANGNCVLVSLKFTFVGRFQ